MSGCLGCERIAIATATLDDGSVVCDYCEQYRHECEVRAVIAMPGQRREHIDGVRKLRGAAAAEKLEQDVRDGLARKRANGGQP